PSPALRARSCKAQRTTMERNRCERATVYPPIPGGHGIRLLASCNGRSLEDCLGRHRAGRKHGKQGNESDGFRHELGVYSPAIGSIKGITGSDKEFRKSSGSAKARIRGASLDFVC